MRLEGTIHCDGPDCPAHQHVSVSRMANERLPVGWLRVTEYCDRDAFTAFCTWDCLMKYAASYEPPEVIEGG